MSVSSVKHDLHSSTPTGVAPVGSARSGARNGRARRRLFRHKPAVISLIFLALLAVVAIGAPVLSPHDPAEITIAFQAPPSKTHPLGTDLVGRDVLSRLLYGSRVSLSVGLISVGLYTLVGMILGTIAGAFGGWYDLVLSRLADVTLSFPPLILILVAVSVIGPGLTNIILILAVLGWPTAFRLVRGEMIALREREMVEAARALGASNVRIGFRHLLPNALGPILVLVTFGVGQAILMEAALSFLGVGVQPPTASWGNLLTDAQSISVLEGMPWLWLPPGLLIFLVVLAINVAGDGLRDALDPKTTTPASTAQPQKPK